MSEPPAAPGVTYVVSEDARLPWGGIARQALAELRIAWGLPADGGM